jgi:2-dehydropantoate 2-reductase
MSSLQDLEAGRPLEIHETLGYAVSKAAHYGVPMPLLEAFYGVLAALDRVNTRRDERPNGSTSPTRC